MNITEIINELLKHKADAQALAKDKKYNATFRDAAQDEVDTLTGCIELLKDGYKLKICSCGQAFAASYKGQEDCDCCEEHQANRYATQQALDFDRSISGGY